MNSVDEVLAELKRLGRPKHLEIFRRHGGPINMYGVSIADLKTVAKTIKGNQALACALYETGNADAMYLAGMVADGSQMTKKQLEAWAKGATWHMLSEYTVAWVASESPYACELAMKWIDSKQERVVTSGWCTWSGIVTITADEDLDLAQIKELLNRVVQEIAAVPNEVRATMNAFVIAVGTYVKPLLKQAKAAAKSIGVVSVDVGDTACKIPLATQYIEKAEKAGRVGKKRKTIKC